MVINRIEQITFLYTANTHKLFHMTSSISEKATPLIVITFNKVFTWSLSGDVTCCWTVNVIYLLQAFNGRQKTVKIGFHWGLAYISDLYANTAQPKQKILKCFAVYCCVEDT